MEDVKVTLYDGSYHDVDSSEMAFKLAGSMAFREAAKKANPVILEPMMKLRLRFQRIYGRCKLVISLREEDKLQEWVIEVETKLLTLLFH